jgi:hypothetical protein
LQALQTTTSDLCLSRFTFGGWDSPKRQETYLGCRQSFNSRRMGPRSRIWCCARACGRRYTRCRHSPAEAHRGGRTSGADRSGRDAGRRLAVLTAAARRRHPAVIVGRQVDCIVEISPPEGSPSRSSGEIDLRRTIGTGSRGAARGVVLAPGDEASDAPAQPPSPRAATDPTGAGTATAPAPCGAITSIGRPAAHRSMIISARAGPAPVGHCSRQPHNHLPRFSSNAERGHARAAEPLRNTFYFARAGAVLTGPSTLTSWMPAPAPGERRRAGGRYIRRAEAGARRFGVQLGIRAGRGRQIADRGCAYCH